MKKHKRDKAGRAYTHGFVTGVRGHSIEICPYVAAINLRAAWLGGWREGRAQYFQGFTGLSSNHGWVESGQSASGHH